MSRAESSTTAAGRGTQKSLHDPGDASQCLKAKDKEEIFILTAQNCGIVSKHQAKLRWMPDQIQARFKSSLGQDEPAAEIRQREVKEERPITQDQR